MGIHCVLQRMDNVICFLPPALCTWVFVRVDAWWRWDVGRLLAPAALTPNHLCPTCPLWSALHLVPEFAALESFWPWVFFSVCVLRLSAVRSGQNVLMADCPSLTFSSASTLCYLRGVCPQCLTPACLVWCLLPRKMVTDCKYSYCDFVLCTKEKAPGSELFGFISGLMVTKC